MSGPRYGRILIIDDNPEIHEDFRRILCRNSPDSSSLDAQETLLFGNAPTKTQAIGFDIDSAGQGEEGLKLVTQAKQEHRPYAVAFVDVRMPPGWDGVETIERIWRIDPDLQFVICSAYSDYTPNEILARLGISDRLLLLKKPFDSAEILLATTTLCEKWNLGRAAKSMLRKLADTVWDNLETKADYVATGSGGAV
jgi:CheY-like chemotaxis protein